MTTARRSQPMRRMQKPSPPNAFGGESWLRGRRLRTHRPIHSAMRLLAATLFFPKASSGDSESTALEAA